MLVDVQKMHGVARMSRYLPPLTALRAFEAVGRVGSLQSAAQELSVHRTVVGRHVRNLETWLGVKLVDNSLAETRLTEAGNQFFETISSAFDLIGSATHSLRPIAGAQVRVWCGPGLNKMWLMPRVRQIKAELDIEMVLLRATDHLPDFRRFEADVAVHYGREYVPNSNTIELCRPRLLAVASSGFAAQFPKLREPQDLLNAPLLHEQSDALWTNWFGAHNVRPSAPLTGPRLGYSHIALEAAVQGQGVALVNELLAGSELKAGRLVEIVNSDVSFGSYVFYAARNRWNEPAIAHLRSWLVEAMSTMAS